ncbi:MAG: DEAD/DEAH box helicase family protein, partial [Bacteroidales bacterium]|nr:DEAD/DEAH box helicase family protein [Bacteroidales bacterium]
MLDVEPLPPILPTELRLWESVALYYLCSVGEVFKAAYPALQVKQEAVKPRKSVEHFLQEAAKWDAGVNDVIKLSGVQQKAYESIKGSFAQALGKPVLLRGVTGSGKTEIYITLAQECLRRGQNVLYLVPEIAISKQLQSRLKKVFGERLLTFHSKQTAAEKARIHRILQYNAAHPQEAAESATVVLG